MLKRDMLLCIRDSGTSNIPVVLPVVDDAIDVSTKDVATKITNINISKPRFAEQKVNRGKKETTLKFTTYIKPHTSTGTSLADKLLYESLLGYNITDSEFIKGFGTGVYGTGIFGSVVPSTVSDIELATSTTNFESVDTYVLKTFDIFLIYSNTTFSLKNAVTVSANFKFDIKGIARVEWTVAGVDYIPDSNPGYSYSENIDSYILNNWTKAYIHIPPLNRSYTLAATNFSLSIKNTIKFPYNELMSERYAKPINSPILDKRSITADYSMYFVSTILYNSFIQMIEEYSYLDDAISFSALLGPCDSEYLEITLDNIVLSLPKIKLEEASTLSLVMSSDKATFNYKNKEV